MPVDKQQNGKPFTPSLSSNFRATKSPLTPRLAGSGPNTPSSGPRREAFVRARSPGKEEQPAPLAGNITPRSAARRSRIGTESPSTTPTLRAATASPAIQSASIQQGLGIASPLPRGGTFLQEVQNHVPSPSPLSAGQRRASGTRSTFQVQEEDPRFIRADEIRSHHPPNPTKPTTNPDSPFFYVGGTSNIVSPNISPIRTGNPPSEDKFFHASDTRVPGQQRAARPDLHARKTTGSAVSVRPVQQNSVSHTPARSPSPGKTMQVRPNSGGKDGPAKPLSVASAFASPSDKRRGSIGSNLSNVRDVQPCHKKSMSANSVATTPTRKLSASRPVVIPTLEERLAGSFNISAHSAESLPIPTASPESISPRSVSLGSQISDGSLPNTRLNTTPGTSKDPSTNASSLVNSIVPESTPASSLPPLSPPLLPTTNPTDPALQARRERKVLDLEISNSSLLAINKTLERELRKQNVELRRFRRLSRSGRLSFAPTGRNISNSTLGTLPELDDESMHSASASDSEDLDDLDDDLDVLSNQSGEGVLSPSTARVRQRARDEKRLMLDLSKHQQMLLDSQKLSQSIRRCLTCTEELIKDGTKALEYKPDVHLGGRVLNNDEVDDRHIGNTHGDAPDDGASAANSSGEARKGLLSPAVEIGDWLAGGLWVSQGRPDSRLDDDVDREGLDGGGDSPMPQSYSALAPNDDSPGL